MTDPDEAMKQHAAKAKAVLEEESQEPDVTAEEFSATIEESAKKPRAKRKAT